MEIHTETILLAILSCFNFQYAVGYPTQIDANSVSVEIAGVTHTGLHLTEGEQDNCPIWLLHRWSISTIRRIYVFIRTGSGKTYSATLPSSSEPVEFDPNHPPPVSAGIHLECNNQHKYYTAEGFQEFTLPQYLHEMQYPHYPYRERIYIVMRGGPVYSAALVLWIPPLRHLDSNVDRNGSDDAHQS